MALFAYHVCLLFKQSNKARNWIQTSSIEKQIFNFFSKCQAISDKLVTYDIIKSNLSTEILKPIRAEYLKLLHVIFNQQVYLPPQIAYTSDSSALANRHKYLTNQSPRNGTRQILYSRYYSDFEEIEKLASGGFGSVYKVNKEIISLQFLFYFYFIFIKSNKKQNKYLL